MTTKPYTLYTFSVSHFSEKIRWLLGAAKLPFAERPLVPFFHVPKTLKLGGGKATTVPILVTPTGNSIQDSTGILHYLEDQHLLGDLLPAEHRSDILTWEDRADRVGSQIIRLAYYYLLPHREAVLTNWCHDANFLQRRFLQTAYPALRWVFAKNFKIGTASAQKAEIAVLSLMDGIALATQDSGYLVGGRLSVADITCAALLAPLVGPSQHPLYSLPKAQQLMQEHLPKVAQHPAAAWVRAMYDQHR